MYPSWTIIIPVKPGGDVRAIESLREMDYPRNLVEIIVSEGCRPSSQRNRAVAAAAGELLYFLDDDSQVKPDFLQKAASHYVDPHVAVVGGPSLTPRSDTVLQQAFGAALSSLIGGGSVRNRYRLAGSTRSTAENELILCNLSFRREIYLACGGLDERLYPNEENELMDRILHNGWELIHDPDLAVMRSQRRRYQDFVRQLFTYGRGRGEQTHVSRKINLASLVPSLFLLYLMMAPFLDNPVYTLPLLCYAGAVAITALWEALQRQMALLFPLLLISIPTLHLAYGAGMLVGLARPRFRDSGKSPAEVQLRRVEL
ncbi:glycosyltransferase family 2 protein [Geobacter sp. OR-1]|uniref:glycosyltransferase n=1 Tax=Geobacter sp. OR-1 TaxID=1266765 RepID=UPI0006944B1F|nr:glycosyltransferase [Geobacter sp. OR-1]